MAVNSITRQNILQTIAAFIPDSTLKRSEKYLQLIDELATMAADDGLQDNVDSAGLVLLDAITLQQ